MQIKIRALDTLFFRDGKPFFRGEESWADGIFPPAPGTFYGALRSLYFSRKPEDIPHANTATDPTRDLKIRGIYFYKDAALQFINPRDSVVEEKKKNETYHILSIQRNTAISSHSMPYRFCLPKEDRAVEDREGLISHTSFENYIMQGGGVRSIKEFANYVLQEPKVGIGRNKHTNTTEEGLLYRVGMQRMVASATSSPLYFVLDIEGFPLPDLTQGFLKLGGEGKAVYFETFEEALALPEYTDTASDIVKLYLLTPAIFEQGWLPRWVYYNEAAGEYRGTVELDNSKETIELRLLTASIGKPLSIGGFDLKKRKPKPLRKAVPAGSVYYFQVLDKNNTSNISQAFHLKSISDFQQKEGFGITLVAKPNL